MKFRRLSLTAVVLIGLALAAGFPTGPATASGALTNTVPRGLKSCNPRSVTISKACKAGAIADFNRARAKEGLRPLVLPSNFTSLKPAQQMLVLTNLDRVAHGLRAYVGINATLSGIALTGTNRAQDPAFPSWARQGGSNWASTVNPFWTEFLWVYDDGPGATNLDCTRTHTSGCWGHRLNVLARWQAPLAFGVAVSPKHGTGALYLGVDGHDATVTWRWSSEAKYFPGGKLP